MGCDAGKKVKGREIHALVDSEGLPVRVVVHSAAIQDRDGAGLVLDKIRRRFQWLELVWADGGYNAWQVDAAVAKVPLLRLKIVKRSDSTKGVVVLPRRWVVKRTFSWFGRNRRLAKDFENLADTLATFVTLASSWPERRSAASILLPAANGGCGCAEGTFAGSYGNGKDAPKPTIRGTEIERQGSTQSRPPKSLRQGSTFRPVG